jgi:hypothetical protein
MIVALHLQGHVREMLNGMDLVRMPGQRVFEIGRRDQIRVDLVTTVDNGANRVESGEGDNQMEDGFDMLVGQSLLGSAVGAVVTENDLFGAPSSSAASSSALPHVTAHGPSALPNAASSASTAPQDPSPSTATWGFSLRAKSAHVHVAADDGAGGADDEVVDVPKGRKRAKAEPKARATKGVVKKDSPNKLQPTPTKLDSAGFRRGRPQRDLTRVTTDFLAKFLQAEQGESYFSGKEKYQQARWIEQLLVDLKAQKDTEDEVKRARTIQIKTVNIVIEVLGSLCLAQTTAC